MILSRASTLTYLVPSHSCLNFRDPSRDQKFQSRDQKFQSREQTNLLILVTVRGVNLDNFQTVIQNKHVLLVQRLFVETNLFDHCVCVGSSWDKLGV